MFCALKILNLCFKDFERIFCEKTVPVCDFYAHWKLKNLTLLFCKCDFPWIKFFLKLSPLPTNNAQWLTGIDKSTMTSFKNDWQTFNLSTLIPLNRTPCHNSPCYHSLHRFSVQFSNTRHLSSQVSQVVECFSVR